MGTLFLIMAVIFVVGLMVITSALTEDDKFNITTLVKLLIGFLYCIPSGYMMYIIMEINYLLNLIQSLN